MQHSLRSLVTPVNSGSDYVYSHALRGHVQWASTQ